MKIKGAVFDMDGLMFDTENLTYKLQNEILKNDFGVDYTLEQYKKTIGIRSADLVSFFKELCGENFDFQLFHEKCRASFKSYTDKYGVPIKDGLFELLDFLKSKGIKIALATSTTTKSATRILKISDTFGYFDELICAENVENGKPHPEPFKKAAQKLGLKPGECIALEDSFNGIKSACSAGLIPIMIPDLIEPTEEIREMCYKVAGNLRDVAELLNMQ